MSDLHVNKKSSTKVGYGKFKNKVCVRKASGEVVNVYRNKATSLVESGGQYVPRSIWKQEVRDVAQVTETTTSEIKAPKKNPKGKARKQKKVE